MGDLITVESLDNRKSFFARVCGVQEVEIFAQAVKTEEPAPLARLEAVSPAVATAKPATEIRLHEGELTSWNEPRQFSNTRMQLRNEP